MASVCFYFQIHQPYRLRRYSVFDTDGVYFDEQTIAEGCRAMASRCYLPANAVLLDAIRRHGGRFRVAFSITGAAIEQWRAHCPEVIAGFQELADTGCVEFLAETYYHSLAYFHSRDEFREQVALHRDLMVETFGQTPRVLRHTELIYDNDLAVFAGHLGYAGVLCEGPDAILGARGPNRLYHPSHSNGLRLLVRNYRMSDCVALRFSDRKWPPYPLSPAKFASWINQISGSGDVCNLFFNYETFGHRQQADTGIFNFLNALPDHILSPSDHNDFRTPGEAIDASSSAEALDVPKATSWDAPDHDMSAWSSNAMQSNALVELFKLERAVKEKGDPQLLTDWRRLTSSDHIRYMSTKDGMRPSNGTPYESPYDGYINFMNVLDHVQSRAK